MTTPERFITDADGTRTAVILDIAAYEALIEAAEDVEDARFARDYDARKAAGTLTADEQERVPFDQVMAEIAAQQSRNEAA